LVCVRWWIRGFESRSGSHVQHGDVFGDLLSRGAQGRIESKRRMPCAINVRHRAKTVSKARVV
jgi:hypothetical protein